MLKESFRLPNEFLLSELASGDRGTVVGVVEDSSTFLQHLDKLGLVLGAKVEIEEYFEFDGSLQVALNNEKVLNLSKQVHKNIYIKKESV
jgi:DtxR family Mn-dependent transcriptional regulator